VARRRSPVRARLAPLSFLNRIAPTLPWFFAVAERDHTIQNPTSPEKLRRLGELLRLDPQSRLVDLACGRGGPAIILAETFGCRIVGVELAPEFVQVARERIAEAGLESLIDVIERDGRKFPLEPNAFDAALCLGASFIWDGLDGTLATLAPAVRASGHVVVGEPFWREWPLPDGIDPEGFTSLPGTIVRFQAADLVPVGLGRGLGGRLGRVRVAALASPRGLARRAPRRSRCGRHSQAARGGSGSVPDGKARIARLGDIRR
jgi:SAM-dependent methyltransferase